MQLVPFGALVYCHPYVRSHVVGVLHRTGAGTVAFAAQTPAAHLPCVAHSEDALHVVSSGSALYEHVCVLTSHVPASWQESSSGHGAYVAMAHVWLARHVAVATHVLLYEHGVPAANYVVAAVLPVTGSQLYWLTQEFGTGGFGVESHVPLTLHVGDRPHRPRGDWHGSPGESVSHGLL